MPITFETYQRVALEDPEGKWELVCGRLRRKPEMTVEHAETARNLARQLILQLRWEDFSVDQESTRLRVSTGNYFIPDVCVIPREIVRAHRRLYPGVLEVYEEPMPLVVEVWSPSTGTHDLEEKLREYQLRGDLEIWRLHPYDRTLTASVRQHDGTYRESTFHGVSVRPVALPNVSIDLDALFE